MSQKRKNTDYLDDLFDKHFNDKDFMNTNLADFGQMVRDTINEEARKQGYDTMSDLISGEIQEGLSGSSRTRKRPVSAAVHRRHGRYRTRYEYVREMLENVVYPPRQRGYYRDGHQDALQRYLRRMAINQNDMMMYEKIVDEEIRKYYQQNSRQRSNKYDEGYYDGLKLVARALKQSRDLMMEENSDRLAAALKVY